MFENGIVLMNGSADTHAVFNLMRIDPKAKYRRNKGVVDPKWNNGENAGGTVDLPPCEALFLLK